LKLSADQINDLILEYSSNTRALKEDLLRICWFMRGGIGYDECHMLTHDEKLIVSKIIEKNLETTKESGMPFF
jgi:hypothetical protein